MHLMFQQYEERLVRRQATPSTLKNFRRTATLFEESGLDPLAADDWQLEEWLAGLQVPRTNEDGQEASTRRCLSPRTVRLHAENLSAAYGYCVYRRQIERSPMEAVRLPRIPDKAPNILSNEDLRHILGNCITLEQELMMRLFVYTGMRRDEVRRLQWDDIKPTTITVRAGKGSKLRHVPLHPELADVILASTPKTRHVIPGRGDNPLTDGGLFYRLEKVRGDVRCTFHDFRRTVSSNLFKNGVDTLIIDKIMGWAPRTVGSRYYIDVADDTTQSAILKLYANDPLTRR